VLVVDALRAAEHPTHFSLEEALSAAIEVEAKETWLTHLSHEYVVDEISNSLPVGVRMAWDGLRISLKPLASLA
jgi:phosphoribosyl 1,2-cyclic phosphate phosphodiesterase